MHACTCCPEKRKSAIPPANEFTGILVLYINEEKKKKGKEKAEPSLYRANYVNKKNTRHIKRKGPSVAISTENPLT